MTLGAVTGSITNIVGMGLVAGVAVKTLDVVGNATSGKKMKKRSKGNDNIFDFGFDQPKRKSGKKRRRNDDDIFGMGSFY